jgi:catechol 2,3-dioxygenase-like lactoylglutathione lyase family enzyme
MFRAVHPILGTRDLERALDFYQSKLGFTLAFRDPSGPTNYAGVRRDGVELHMQWQDEHEMSTIRLRFLVDDPDQLFAEWLANGAVEPGRKPKSTPWGSREFALYDPDRNALTFYRDLTRAEMRAGAEHPG